MAPQSTVERTRLLEGTGLAGRRERLAGISTAILEVGSGPPLILLHGGIECGGARTHIERPESFLRALRATIDPPPNRSAA
jgi:hypothetical protein